MRKWRHINSFCWQCWCKLLYWNYVNSESTYSINRDITCRNLTWSPTTPINILLKCLNISCTGMPLHHSSVRVLEVPYKIRNLIHDNESKPLNERTIKSNRQHMWVSAVCVLTPNIHTNALCDKKCSSLSLYGIANMRCRFEKSLVGANAVYSSLPLGVYELFFMSV